MKQVAIIGNSHLGCLRQWITTDGQGSSLNGLDITFYGAPADHLTRVRRVGAKLRTKDRAGAVHFIKTSGKGSDVWLENYDAVILHGLCFPTLILNTMLKKFSPAPSADKAFITGGCLKAILREVMTMSPFVRLAREVKAAVDLPVILSMGPFLAETILQAKPEDVAQLVECGAFMKKIDLDELAALAHEIGVQLSLQPEETLKSPVLTKAKFSLKHINPRINDHGHMNPTYGGLVLRQLADTLNGVMQAA